MDTPRQVGARIRNVRRQCSQDDVRPSKAAPGSSFAALSPRTSAGVLPLADICAEGELPRCGNVLSAEELKRSS
jgi:hypothetical protein